MGRRVVHRADYVSPEEVARRRNVMREASTATRRTIIAYDVAVALQHIGPVMSPAEFAVAMDAHESKVE